jgi:hypothetical protein
MSEDMKYRNYLFDVGLLIKEKALEIKRKSSDDEGETRVFYRGQLFAYAEVISLMQQEADAFGIGLGELRLDDIEPEGDLI